MTDRDPGEPAGWQALWHAALDPLFAARRGRLRGAAAALGGGGFPGGFPPGAPGGMPPGGFPPGGLPWLRSLLMRGMRARRGDVRLAILALLVEQPRNGYQIMRELEQRSRGAWRPSPGSVYPALAQLEDEGLVTEEASGAVPGGRVFELTEAGRAYAKEHREEMAAPWEAGRSSGWANPAFVALLTQMRQVVAATTQIVQNGNAAQIAAAQKVLSGARRELYELLAQADDAGDDE
jgi:DNA-binding PadR family transcriptional regulator